MIKLASPSHQLRFDDANIAAGLVAFLGSQEYQYSRSICFGGTHTITPGIAEPERASSVSLSILSLRVDGGDDFAR